MPTTTTTPETDTELDQQIEKVLAALPPAAQTTLASIGAGDTKLSRSLLEAIPADTATTLETHGILTPNHELTALGAEIAHTLAHKEGLAAKPSLRSHVTNELQGRLQLIQHQKAAH